MGVNAGIIFIQLYQFTLIDVNTGNGMSNIPAAFKIPAPTPEWTAVPVSALTATGGLEQACSIKRGQNVLVTAASGGTGHVSIPGIHISI